MSAGKIQEVVAIMDRSGSMNGKVDDAVGGFNSTLEILRKEQTDNSTINVSIKLFDHEEEMLIRSMPLADVKPLETSQFIPRGQTALLDAMGNTIKYFMEKKLMDPKAYDYCTIYIVTDGKENYSNKFTRKNIKELVQNAELKYNIKVIYLGANQDAIFEAENIGISPGQAINYSESHKETYAAYRSAASMVRRHRSGASVEFLQTEREASYNSNRPLMPTRAHSLFNEPTSTPLYSCISPPPIMRQKSSRNLYSVR